MPISAGIGMNGMTEDRRRVVYLDANPFIYLIEGTPDIAGPIDQLVKLLRRKPKIGVTSELTFAEVLPRAPSAMHRRLYFNLILWSGVFELVPVSRQILLESAQYRRAARRKQPDGSKSIPKLPDAIHVVTAIRSGRRVILSRDHRLRIPRPLVQLTPDSDGIVTLMQELA